MLKYKVFKGLWEQSDWNILLGILMITSQSLDGSVGISQGNIAKEWFSGRENIIFKHESIQHHDLLR